MVDVQKLYENCLNLGKKDKITPRTIYDYMVSPYMVYCNKYGPKDEKDPITEYMRLLFEQGNTHEEQVIETNYPDIEKVKYDTPEEGFMALLEDMKKGASAICGTPIFYLPEGLNGKLDAVERNDSAPSIFGDYHYVVKEIKLAKNIKGHHLMQAALYNYMLGKIQGYTPPFIFVVNRDMADLEFPYDENTLLAILQDIREILDGKEVSPTYGACQWPWESYNNKEAIEKNDVSLVSGVGPSSKMRLAEAGFATVDDLAEAEIDELISIKRIGEKTADKFIAASRALKEDRPICKGHCDFPERSTEIFLDLEGTGEQIEDEELVSMDYLIGVLVRKDGKEEYISFFAQDLDKEGEMFNEFMDWLTTQEDFIIYHWHHYEKTHLTRMADRHELSNEGRDLLFRNMRDLYKDAVSTFAFPTYGNGLKQVAKFMGYNWKHADVDAMESIAFYFQYAKNPEEHKEKMQKVIDYNEDDCFATRVVKDWLVENLEEKW